MGVFPAKPHPTAPSNRVGTRSRLRCATPRQARARWMSITNPPTLPDLRGEEQEQAPPFFILHSTLSVPGNSERGRRKWLCMQTHSFQRQKVSLFKGFSGGPVGGCGR
jgi:hypothetical protein